VLNPRVYRGAKHITNLHKNKEKIKILIDKEAYKKERKKKKEKIYLTPVPNFMR
jgi:hypothetical protein